MRVVFVASSYPSKELPSRGIFVHRLARGLIGEGVDVLVIAPGAPAAPAQELYEEVPVHRARYGGKRGQRLTATADGIVPTIRSKPWLAYQAPLLVSSLALSVRRLAREGDVVHAHWIVPSGLASAMGRHHGIPLVVTAHGTDVHLTSSSASFRALTRFVANRVDACLAVGKGIAARLVEIGVPSEKIVHAPLGIDIDEPKNCPQEESFRRFSSGREKRVIFVGRLVSAKSVHTLIEALSELRNRGVTVRCAIVGGGPEERALKSLARRLDIDVIFAGPCPPTEVRAWISVSDVLVLPSTEEGRGVVLLEAMAEKKPVVTSDIPGPREVVEEGVTGFLFPPGDWEKLADGLERIFEDPAKARSMGKAGRDHLETLGVLQRQSVERHRDLYRSLAR